jgi:formylglycine-generating enzyme required for sulfatase activity
MQHYLRQRFAKLLIDLPDWDSEGRRTVLLREILGTHKVFAEFDCTGSRPEAAEKLLVLLEQHPDAMCRLLAGLSEASKAAPERLSEIDGLRVELCAGRVRRRRERWLDVPYKGLNYFDRDDAPIFFGRERETQALIEKLTENPANRFTVVLGASGSGKSSLMRAGLWAALADGDVEEFPGSEQWLITTVAPTITDASFVALLKNELRREIPNHKPLAGSLPFNWKKIVDDINTTPLRNVAEQLLSTLPKARWLLLLDQMEELFAPDAKEECDRALAKLLESTQVLADGKPGRFQVVATLRDDFLATCLQWPMLPEALNRTGATFYLGPPNRLALEQMVRGPIEELTLDKPWTIHPRLPSRMASDAEGQSGGLALMAFALRELYAKCESNHRMELTVYESKEFGGLGKAIARRADEVLSSVGEGGEDVLHRVFRHLVRVTADLAPIRRREPLTTWEKDPEATRLIDDLLEARLLVSGRAEGEANTPLLEVAHEALLREWPTLARWIDSQREVLRLRDRVKEEAKTWAGSELDRQHRRSWQGDLIDRYREQLEEAGLLTEVLKDAATARFLTPEAEWILEEIRTPETSPLRRWEIGCRLAGIGDPRPGVGLRSCLPDILWRSVPRGEVELEKLGCFTVEPFAVAAYPITFSQFSAFWAARDGYWTDEWWEGLQRETVQDAWRLGADNHPVTQVSWHDAQAFCRWLSAAMSMEVRLPFESEWQWAAQSAHTDNVYPWGKEWIRGFANTSESGINHTSAVGSFPQGDSRQGVSDLSGNVWEWCLDEHPKPNDAESTKSASRGVRGGSWSSGSSSARAPYRMRYRTIIRFNNIGFRVVCQSPLL